MTDLWKARRTYLQVIDFCGTEKGKWHICLDMIVPMLLRQGIVMRIPRTSGWYLGQSFYSKNHEAGYQAFLDWLLEIVQAHQVDTIIIAGDTFDTGSSSSYAHTLYNRFVVNLQQTGCHLVILAGNHDSVITLSESRDIVMLLNTTMVVSAGHTPRILPRRDGTPGAVLCPIPFLRPRDITTSQAGLSDIGKQQHLLAAVTGYYQ